MKAFLSRMRALGVVALLVFSGMGAFEAQARPGDRVSFRTFYDELDPYGRWINDSEYGYVWSPDVERGFQPYATRGHWVMTEYGNTWVSDYDWGWAPFHYGRWMHDDYYGWLWIPGSDWGPAWVDWRNGGGYYGWAPMGPRMAYIVPAVRWVFVPMMYITSPRVFSYCVPRTNIVNIYHNTTIINNYYERDNRRYVYGPRNQDIERATNRRLNVHRVENDSRAGRTAVADNSVRTYRPEVNGRREDAPSRVVTRDKNGSRSLLTASDGATGRADRSNNTTRNRSISENESARTRATAEGSATTRGRTRMVSTTSQRETGAEPIREREGRLGMPAPTGEERSLSRSERSGYPSRTRELNGSESRTRTSAEYPAPRSERGYSPRRSESGADGQYQQRTRQQADPESSSDSRTRPEPAREVQHQTRIRQETAPAPATREKAPRQETAPAREGSRRTRN